VQEYDLLPQIPLPIPPLKQQKGSLCPDKVKPPAIAIVLILKFFPHPSYPSSTVLKETTKLSALHPSLSPNTYLGPDKIRSVCLTSTRALVFIHVIEISILCLTS
jgi:hypothetical protein